MSREAREAARNARLKRYERRIERERLNARLDNPQPYAVRLRFRLYGRQSAPLREFMRRDEAEAFARRQPLGRMKRWAAQLWPGFGQYWRASTWYLCMIVTHPTDPQFEHARKYKNDLPPRRPDLPVFIGLEDKPRQPYNYDPAHRAALAREGHEKRKARQQEAASAQAFEALQRMQAARWKALRRKTRQQNKALQSSAN